ncbi:hypothetical protein OQA88_12365 [Cercophora sp. LCS_1]
MKELLDTDRVNYLVWRYLLESNYRDAAANLQKEWRISQPHRHFDFAPFVKGHALTTLLNKGLLYEDAQRQFAEQRGLQETAGARGVFGPLKFESDRNAGEDGDEEDSEPDHEPEEHENSRKRPVDRQHHGASNGSPAKRQRLNNGYENGADSATDPMEIDHQQDNNHAYPSPLEGEQAASPLPRTEGPDKGTQVEKAHELTQETIFLRLGADEAAETSEASPGRASENPIVLVSEWNPQDPSSLAAAGTDALARVWTVSRGAVSDTTTQPDHVDGVTLPFMNLADDDLPRSAFVNSMAWNSKGDAIAIAFEYGSGNNETGNRARISIMAPDGTNLHRIDGIEPPVIKLRWSPSDEYILSVSPEKRGTLVTVFSSKVDQSLSYFVDHDIGADPLDATWISDTDFVLCGGDLLISLHCTENGIVPGRTFETGRDECFTHVQFDWRSRLMATASEKGVIDLWTESGERRSINAHIGPIYALQWQPLQTEPTDDERLLASSGDDGAICIWNVRSLDTKQPKHSMTMSSAVLNLSMTPDGAFIAGATNDRIMIWKVGDSAFPRASWNKTPHPGWLSPKDKEEDDQPCLGWDSEGQKLVYGANSRCREQEPIQEAVASAQSTTSHAGPSHDEENSAGSSSTDEKSSKSKPRKASSRGKGKAKAKFRKLVQGLRPRKDSSPSEGDSSKTKKTTRETKSVALSLRPRKVVSYAEASSPSTENEGQISQVEPSEEDERVSPAGSEGSPRPRQRKRARRSRPPVVLDSPEPEVESTRHQSPVALNSTLTTFPSTAPHQSLLDLSIESNPPRLSSDSMKRHHSPETEERRVRFKVDEATGSGHTFFNLPIRTRQRPVPSMPALRPMSGVSAVASEGRVAANYPTGSGNPITHLPGRTLAASHASKGSVADEHPTSTSSSARYGKLPANPSGGPSRAPFQAPPQPLAPTLSRATSQVPTRTSGKQPEPGSTSAPANSSPASSSSRSLFQRKFSAFRKKPEGK